MEETSDWTRQIVERWRGIRPDLDPAPMLIIARIARLAVLLDDLLRPPFAAAGLATGDFDLLAALRRQGPPHETSPGDLAVAMLVTTGATTKRIDRLERQGYVTRHPSDADGRKRVVALTAAGRDLVDRLFTVHLTNEASILAALDDTHRDALAGLLAELAKTVEAAAFRAAWAASVSFADTSGGLAANA